MARAATRTRRSYGEKFREFGGRLRDLKNLQWRLRQAEPDMRLNDGWSPQEVERSWQEYGDGGDSWWYGCSRNV
jgi:hypothetical protein